MIAIRDKICLMINELSKINLRKNEHIVGNNQALFASYPDVVGIKEMCEMLNISKPTAYKILSENKICYNRLGKKHFIPKQSIISFCTNLKN